MSSWLYLPRRAFLAAIALLALGGCIAEAAETDDEADEAVNHAACSVAYSVVAESQGGFEARITIRNQGNEAYNGWDLDFIFPNDQQFVTFKGAAGIQSGPEASLSSVSTNGFVAPGASVTFGFIGSVGPANDKPARFTVNGAVCATALLTTSGGGGAGSMIGSGSSGSGT
jgi:hypothetical protein